MVLENLQTQHHSFTTNEYTLEFVLAWLGSALAFPLGHDFAAHTLPSFGSMLAVSHHLSGIFGIREVLNDTMLYEYTEHIYTHKEIHVHGELLYPSSLIFKA